MKALHRSVYLSLITVGVLAVLLAGCADRSGAQALGERFVRALEARDPQQLQRLFIDLSDEEARALLPPEDQMPPGGYRHEVRVEAANRTRARVNVVLREQLSETVLTLTAAKTENGWRFEKGFQASTRIPEIRRQSESSQGG
jgi:hypothetical protein